MAIAYVFYPEPSPESSIRGLWLCAGRLDIFKFTKTHLIYSVSCFNLGGLELCLWGLSPQKSPVATGLFLPHIIIFYTHIGTMAILDLKKK